MYIILYSYRCIKKYYLHNVLLCLYINVIYGKSTVKKPSHSKFYPILSLKILYCYLCIVYYYVQGLYVWQCQRIIINHCLPTHDAHSITDVIKLYVNRKKSGLAKLFRSTFLPN